MVNYSVVNAVNYSEYTPGFYLGLKYQKCEIESSLYNTGFGSWMECQFHHLTLTKKNIISRNLFSGQGFFMQKDPRSIFLYKNSQKWVKSRNWNICYIAERTKSIFKEQSLGKTWVNEMVMNWTKFQWTDFS